MKTKSILLIEDNPDDEELTLRALRKGGVLNDVVVARDGVEALEFLFASGKHAQRDPSQQPAVVLLDLKLPKIDGLEVLRRMRANARTQLLPVVIFSSSLEEQDVMEGYRLGANSFISKPVDMDHFREAVSNFGLYWLRLNDAPPQLIESK
ncbi:MAG: response regulator [Verrucomicrobia bacterium]|nr:response regulator [Verrucomicrobiota bacterium]